MSDTPKKDSAAIAVRHRAEELLRRRPLPGISLASDPGQVRLLHELQVHQIELELQNDDLQRARVEAETALAKYADLFEFAPVAYCTLKLDGTVTEINLTGARWLGCARSQLSGRPLAEFVTPESRAAWSTLLRQAKDTNARVVGEVVLQPVGQAAPLVTQFELERRGVAAELRGVALDITVRARVEAELARQRASLQQQIEAHSAELDATRANEQARDAALFEARRLARARAEFLTNVGHELRTPLNAIMGLTYLMRQENNPLRAVDKLEKIAGAAEHLLAVINDLLDLGSVDAGRLTLDRHPFSVPELLDRVVGLVRSQAQAKGVQLGIDMATELDGRELIGDPKRLGQILVNFASNAVKFTDWGTITVRARTSDEDAAALGLRFEVVDTGIGIPADALPRLFEAFEQVDGPSTRRRGGNGLGLALSRRLAELMGGEVGVTSQSGAGSTFWLAVRLAKVPPRSVAGVAGTTGAASPARELQSRPGGSSDPAAERSGGDAGDPAVRGS